MIDGRRLDVGTVERVFETETNEAVREELTALISRRELSEPEVEGIRLIPLVRTSLATVRVIGGDFVLVELNEDTKRRRLIPKSRVGSIYLDANPVRFEVP